MSNGMRRAIFIFCLVWFIYALSGVWLKALIKKEMPDLKKNPEWDEGLGKFLSYVPFFPLLNSFLVVWYYWGAIVDYVKSKKKKNANNKM